MLQSQGQLEPRKITHTTEWEVVGVAPGEDERLTIELELAALNSHERARVGLPLCKWHGGTEGDEGSDGPKRSHFGRVD